MSSEAKKFEAPKLATPAAEEKPKEVKTSRTIPRDSANTSADPYSDTGQGRRRVPRRAIENRIGVLHRGQYSVGQAFEIGEGGMLFTCPTALKEGDRVVLTVRIPECFDGVVTGTVVYMVKKNPTEIRYGIKFDDIDFENKRKIRNFVASGRTYVV